MEAAPHLSLIATATTGTDHIDLARAKKRGITVLSLKDETSFLRSVTSTAELALGLLIDLARRTHAAAASVKRGAWNREDFVGHSLSGKTLGIVGLGRLGSLMAAYGKALGMTVLYTDPNVTSSEAERVEFADLLRRSDVISIHAHLSEETKHLFDARAFAQMKPAALLINTARGSIVNEADLLAALKSGTLGGFAADVLADELSFDGRAVAPLITYAQSHDNVIITPHIGGMTAESREATDVFIAGKVRDTLQKQ